MSTKAIFVAATALAGGFPGAAFALTPLSIDASAASAMPAESASPYAVAAPEAFKPVSEEAFEPNPVLQRRGPRLQCVPFARSESGVEIYGNANTWWAQAAGRYARERKPEEGAVLVMRGYAGANRGHVAVVREIVSDRVVLVDHSNWLNRGEVTRAVPVRDVSPNHDWTQVQVWHVPGAHWGGRTYRVQGFIVNDNEPADETPALAASEAKEVDDAIAQAPDTAETPGPLATSTPAEEAPIA